MQFSTHNEIIALIFLWSRENVPINCNFVKMSSKVLYVDRLKSVLSTDCREWWHDLGDTTGEKNVLHTQTFTDWNFISHMYSKWVVWKSCSYCIFQQRIWDRILVNWNCGMIQYKGVNRWLGRILHDSALRILNPKTYIKITVLVQAE